MPWTSFNNWFNSDDSNQIPQSGGGAGGIQSGAAIQQSQMMSALSANTQESQSQYVRAVQQSMQQAQEQAIYQSRYYYTPSCFSDLLTTIGSMACSVGANITKITVDRSTYARIMSDLGSVQRSIDSDTLTINTAMGPIQIDWRDNDSKTSNIDLSAYMEDV